MSERPILIGDGIENLGNAQALRDVASLLGWDVAFHDRCGLAEACRAAGVVDALPVGTRDEIQTLSPVIALENAPGADSIYGFRAPPGQRLALVVGNERRGIARDVLDLAHRTVEIPLASRAINTINVAAAAAVAGYFIARGGGGRLHVRADPARHRPDVLVVGPTDAIELGSAIRSVGAFGWKRVFVEDRHSVWFQADRVTKSLGRGAARRGRNAIHVIPTRADQVYAFDEAVVVAHGVDAEPLHRVDLARGPRQLVVVPDAVDLAREDLGRFARNVRMVQLDVPRPDSGRRLRLTASIVLAEVGREVGLRQRSGPGRRRGPTYDTVLEPRASENPGIFLGPSELMRIV